jgi:hypothetical protein
MHSLIYIAVVITHVTDRFTILIPSCTFLRTVVAHPRLPKISIYCLATGSAAHWSACLHIYSMSLVI